MPLRTTRLFSSPSTSAAGVNDGNNTCQPRSLPPSSGSFSTIRGLHPSSARRRAACMPATPPPMTITLFIIVSCRKWYPARCN